MFALKETDAITVKLQSREHSITNSKHACAEGSVTNLKMCYGESVDNFLLSLINGETSYRAEDEFQRMSFNVHFSVTETW
jgi:hypothetical protein